MALQEMMKDGAQDGESSPIAISDNHVGRNNDDTTSEPQQQQERSGTQDDTSGDDHNDNAVVDNMTVDDEQHEISTSGEEPQDSGQQILLDNKNEAMIPEEVPSAQPEGDGSSISLLSAAAAKPDPPSFSTRGDNGLAADDDSERRRRPPQSSPLPPTPRDAHRKKPEFVSSPLEDSIAQQEDDGEGSYSMSKNGAVVMEEEEKKISPDSESISSVPQEEEETNAISVVPNGTEAPTTQKDEKQRSAESNEKDSDQQVVVETNMAVSGHATQDTPDYEQQSSPNSTTAPSHDDTEGTTSLASCRPDPPPSDLGDSDTEPAVVVPPPNVVEKSKPRHSPALPTDQEDELQAANVLVGLTQDDPFAEEEEKKSADFAVVEPMVHTATTETTAAAAAAGSIMHDPREEEASDRHLTSPPSLDLQRTTRDSSARSNRTVDDATTTLLAPLAEHRLVQQHAATSFRSLPPNNNIQQPFAAYKTTTQGRRKMRMRLEEEVQQRLNLRNNNNNNKTHGRTASLLGSIRRGSRQMFGQSRFLEQKQRNEYECVSVDRGTISVSWFEGTSSLELNEHVKKSVARKLKLEKSMEIVDMRVMDESESPPEEIVLSPFIPDGSQFLLQFSLHDTTTNDGSTTPMSEYSVQPPVSPSAAPSPHPTKDFLSGLNANQLALLKIPSETSSTSYKKRSSSNESDKGSLAKSILPRNLSKSSLREREEKNPMEDDDEKDTSYMSGMDDKDMMLHSEDPVEAQLRQITELLINDRKKPHRGSAGRQEKRQVVFVLANYFVLFLSLIAISAEIQARAPGWLNSLEHHMQNVQDCAADQEALFQCVSNGDFAGLVASIIIWLTRSVATSRIFLFGFETQEKLWTVVYESCTLCPCCGRLCV